MNTVLAGRGRRTFLREEGDSIVEWVLNLWTKGRRELLRKVKAERNTHAFKTPLVFPAPPEPKPHPHQTTGF